MQRNLSPITERLATLTDRERCTVLWVLDTISECGWEDFPSRAVWELKLKQKKESKNK